MYPGFVLIGYGKVTDMETNTTKRIHGRQGCVGKYQGRVWGEAGEGKV